MNSKRLEEAQEVIEILLVDEIKEPMKKWALINKYISVLKDIDTKRRKAWNKEKFGVYEEIANDMESDFSMDEIPF